MFHEELTRARDNVVLLTDDREAPIEALETAPAEELSALRAIGEQFETSVSVSTSASAGTVAQYLPPEKPAVPDSAARKRRREAERFVDRTLSAAAAASLRKRDERAREAHTHGAHVTLAPGYAEWREGARRALADSRKILDDPETFGRHLDRRPSTADEIERLSTQIEADFKSDSAEIDRRQKRQEQQKQEHQERERRKAEMRDRGGLSM